MSDAKAPWQDPWWVVVEHPQYGEARVLCKWKRIDRGRLGPARYVAVPVAVEFDLFTPPTERDALLADMQQFVRSLEVEVNRVGFTSPMTAPRPPKLS